MHNNYVPGLFHKSALQIAGLELGSKKGAYKHINIIATTLYVYNAFDRYYVCLLGEKKRKYIYTYTFIEHYITIPVKLSVQILYQQQHF